MSKFVSIPVMKNYFEPGIISTFKGFDSTEESAEIFNRSFVGNACEYYETVYNSTHDGLQMERCEEIFDGILRKVRFLTVTLQGLSIGFQHAFNVMEEIQQHLYDFLVNPSPVYLGAEDCQIPVGTQQVKPLLFSCYAKEKNLRDLCKAILIRLLTRQAAFKDVAGVIESQLKGEMQRYRNEQINKVENDDKISYRIAIFIFIIYYLVLLLPWVYFSEKKVNPPFSFPYYQFWNIVSIFERVPSSMLQSNRILMSVLGGEAVGNKSN